MAGLSSHGAAPSGPLPASAIVLDFICLFTHDLKRKQKRWQDGVLKYHTFNKRIMVSDDRGHFIGDAHWQAEADIEPGDEFQLDRGAAIVQVSDCTGQREQDLTELLDKRARDVEKRRANAISRTPRSSIAATSSPAPDQAGHFQLRHRPLTSLVGASPRIGRAVISPHSPYEARQMAQRAAQPEPSEEPPSPKRRKREQSPLSKSYHARSLFGAALNLSPFPMSSPSSQSQDVGDVTSMKPKAPLLSRSIHQKPQKSSYRQLEAAPQQPVEAESFLVPAAAEPCRPLEASAQLQNDVNPFSAKGEELTRLHQSGDGSVVTSEKINSPRIAPPSLSTPAALTANSQPKKLAVAAPRSRATTMQVRHNESTTSKDEQSSTSMLESTKHPHELNDVTGLPLNHHNGMRPNNEPRTELRIRPRQRRGLLVVSEKHGRDKNGEKRPTVDKGVESQASSESGHLKRGNGIMKTNEPSRNCGQPPTQYAPIDTNEPCKEAVTSVIEAGLHILEDEASNDSGYPIILDSSLEDEPEPLQTRKIKPQEDAGSMKVGDASSLTTNTRPRDRRTRKAVTRQSTSDEDSDATASSPVPKAKGRITDPPANVSSSSAPRITKMARKSVKSREVIGFVPQCDEPMVTAGFGVAPMLVTHGRVGPPASRNIGGREAESQSHTDATPKPPVQPDSVASVAQPDSTGSDDKLQAKATPRLSNPATRGKKAAKRKDAAGHLPQTLIQLDPVLPTRVGAPKPLPSAKLSELPGFSKANGGAWSRHAEDLLGMTRPTDKLSRI